MELWEVATSFSSCEITDERPELIDEIIAVVICVNASLPPVLHCSDHRTPDTRFVDEQNGSVARLVPRQLSSPRPATSPHIESVVDQYVSRRPSICSSSALASQSTSPITWRIVRKL